MKPHQPRCGCGGGDGVSGMHGALQVSGYNSGLCRGTYISPAPTDCRVSPPLRGPRRPPGSGASRRGCPREIGERIVVRRAPRFACALDVPSLAAERTIDQTASYTRSPAPPGTSETSAGRRRSALRSPLSGRIPMPARARLGHVCALPKVVSFDFFPTYIYLYAKYLRPGSVYVPIPALLAAGAALLAVPAYRPA
jgi:hypothetical protein